jgi:pyruvate/2-oxoglutarate/acetoin dehydrogenase E1 component
MPDLMTERTAKLNFAGAANAALERALREDENVILYGEDVALPGGVFGVTKGLQRLYGDRVFDTPISESAMLGVALGAATFGARPIVEIMWADFMLVGLDQIVNQIANARYISQGRITPAITIRTQQGSQPGACAQHSQSLEALLVHVPGIRVCVPSNAQDAYDLLVSAVTLDDPVVVIENRNLYHGDKVSVQLDRSPQPPGRAHVMRTGWDVSLISWGAQVTIALEAAESLAAEGISVEVIDARWLAPFDWPTLFSSIARTSRVAVLHEANLTGGFGAEIIAKVAEQGPPLRARPMRIGTPDARIPAAPALLDSLIPNVARVKQAIRQLVGAGDGN